MKNYLNFITEKNNIIDDLEKLDADNIVMMQVLKNGELQDIKFENKKQKQVFIKDHSVSDLTQFDAVEKETMARVRKAIYAELFCIIDGEPRIFILTLGKLNEISQRIDKSEKVVRGFKIELFQNLGLLYNVRKEDGNLLTPTRSTIFKKEDFDFDLIDDDKDYVNMDYSDLASDNDKFMLLFGSIKFKKFIENRHIYNKRNKFEIKKVLHHDRSEFLKQLLKNEKIVTSELGIDINLDKQNTTDIILTDDKDVLNKLKSKNAFVLSEVSKEINIKGYQMFEGGVCYVLNKSDLVIEDFKKCENKGEWIQKQIDTFGSDAPKFLQISLKKSKTGAQFGKVTKTILNQFSDEDEDINEGIVSFFNKILDDVKSLISKLFPNLNSKKDDIIESETNSIVNKYVEHFNKEIYEEGQVYITEKVKDTTPVEYVAQNFKTEIIGDLFVYNEISEDVPAKVKNLENKKFASNKIDKLISDMIRNARNLNTEPKKFHEKFSEILTVSLMGSTNLPLYMVFGTEEDRDLSFTLHTYRTDKKEKHINDALVHDRTQKPMYILYIRNFKNERNEIEFRSLKVLVFNYSSITDKYICIDTRTNSSSHRSFVAETTAPNDKLIYQITQDYKELLGKK